MKTRSKTSQTKAPRKQTKSEGTVVLGHVIASLVQIDVKISDAKRTAEELSQVVLNGYYRQYSMSADVDPSDDNGDA